MRRLLLPLVLLVPLLNGGTASASAAETLLSQGKPATASSVEDATFPASLAFDGDTTTTRWASIEGSDPQWLQVDLGASRQLSRVKLTWEAAYGKTYKIQLSADGSTWTDAHSTTTGDGGVDEAAITGTARYVRMHGTQRGTSYGYSLYEMQVYGEGGTGPAPGYQAENATLSQAFVDTKHAGFTGTGFVDYVNTTGGYIEWSVTAAAAGPHRLDFRYANNSTTGNRPVAVTVNGANAASVTFPPTGAWTTWTTQAATVTLNAGANTIRATATSNDGGPNIDRLDITPDTGGGTSFVVAAAGDIAQQCTASSSSCIHPKTAALVQTMNPEFVITMGDNQYDDALISDFRNYYDKSWGAFKSKTRPTPGNHETYDPAGSLAGYKAYFGSIAYPNGKPYYSYDHGNWHFVALDSNDFGSTQLNWLKADLAANTKKCVAAYWHHPLYSSGEHGNQPVARATYQALYDARADLVLGGHDHHYERFGPQNANGGSDTQGIVSIIGGTGGASPYAIENVQPNSLKRLTDTYGVVKLNLGPDSFQTQLIGLDGSVKDSGPTYACH
ncbi:discoidin domain-containing protein [Nonomuraea sp. NPDC050663]|uniref:discoidin domain-containing protein n=1 Tax=Nonomuraea sp. NPDC050663 TaxID=3364370 RepID=UPI0037B44136